jgi:hypothetical protein
MFKQLWLGWKAFARRIVDIQAKLFLTFFYFLVVAPFAIGVKLLANPLNLLEKRHSNWVSKTVDKRGLEEARRQF